MLGYIQNCKFDSFYLCAYNYYHLILSYENVRFHKILVQVSSLDVTKYMKNYLVKICTRGFVCGDELSV